MQRRFAMNDSTVGQLDALPAVVAVHRVVAAGECGDFAHSKFAQLSLQLADVVASAVWRRVAAIHKAMDEYALDFLLLGHFQESEQMVDMRMHAAIAQQPEQ